MTLCAEDHSIVTKLDERIAAWSERVQTEDANVAAKGRAHDASYKRYRRAVEERDQAKAELDRLVAAREALS